MIDNDISIVTLPPSYLNLFEGEPFPGLRVLITAGEPPVVGDALHYAKACVISTPTALRKPASARQ